MASPRMQRWALILSGYQFELMYIPGWYSVAARRLLVVEHSDTKLKLTPSAWHGYKAMGGVGPLAFRSKTSRQMGLATSDRPKTPALFR